MTAAAAVMDGARGSTALLRSVASASRVEASPDAILLQHVGTARVEARPHGIGALETEASLFLTKVSKAHHAWRRSTRKESILTGATARG